MYVYIKNNLSSKYLEIERLLDEDAYNVGTTYEDYLKGNWVLLSNEQAKFHEEHPEASVKEVFEMQLVQPYVRTIEDAKRAKIAEIDMYDNSESVNSFNINNAISAWLTVQERLNYKQSVEAAKLIGLEQLAFYIGDTMLTVTPQQAEYMLASIQLYADACFIVTKQHKLAVESLDNIEDVDNYDYTVGYPEKLNFTV